MAIDPYTGEVLPYGPWDGPWPPDPSWDEDPLLASPPILPPPTDEVPAAVELGDPSVVPVAAPEAVQAAAAADALFADEPQVRLGMPRPVPDSVEPIDEDLIGAYEEPVEGDLSYVTGYGETTQGVPQLEDVGPELAAPAPHAKGADYSGKPTSDELAAMDPVAFQMLQAKQQMAAEDEAITKKLEAGRLDRERAEDNETVYRQAVARATERRAAIDAEAQRLATEQVDPNGWRNSRTLFQTIAMYATAVVGGLVQSRQGLAQNPGLAMINQAIEQHIDAQKANLAHRRAMLGEQRAALDTDVARMENDLRTEEAFRIAAWQRASDQIEAEKLQYDPAGTRAVKYEALQREIRANMAAAQKAAFDADLKQQLEIGRHDLEVAKHNETVRKNFVAEQLAARKAAAAGAGGTSASKAKYTREDLAKLFPGSPIPPEGVPPMTVAEYGQWAESANKGKRLGDPSEGEKLAHERLITSPADGAVLLGKNPETGKYDREDWVTGNPEETRVKLDAAYKVIDLLDEADAIRDRVGGESSWGNSDDFQRLETIGKELLIARKAGTQGMSSDADMANLETAIGAKNLTSFRSQAARIKQARSMTKRGMNAWLNGHGYDGKPLAFRNNYKAATKSPDEAVLDEMVKHEGKKQLIPTAAIAAGPLGATLRAGEALLRDEESSVPERFKREIDQWSKDAKSTDPKARRKARGLLQGAVDRANSTAIRKYAEAALMAARMENVAAKSTNDAGKFSIKAVMKAVEEEAADEQATDDEEDDE